MRNIRMSQVEHAGLVKWTGRWLPGLIVTVLLSLTIALSVPMNVMAEARENVPTLLIVRSAPTHSIEIENAFKEHMVEMGYEDGKTIHYLPTKVVSPSLQDFSETAMMVRAAFSRNPDVIVTIGTQASVPTWLVARDTDIPIVFSGVTYPVEGGLINAYGEPTGRNITGIGYSIPTRQRLELLRFIFPDREAYRRMAFIYSGQVLQDFTYRKELEALGNVGDWEIVYVDYFDYAQNTTSQRLLRQKLSDADPDLAIGWYSLDSLCTDDISFNNFIKWFGKPVVSITSIMTDQGAIGGVLTDHGALGVTQAKWVARILQGNPVGQIAPVEPTDYLIELNLKAAAEMGIQFDQVVLDSAFRLVK